MRSLLPRTLSLAALLVASCAPPPPPARPLPVVLAPPVMSASAAPATTPPDPAIVSVTAVRAPAHFALDGDLTEWGSLLPPIPSPPPKDAPAKRPPAPGEPEEPSPPPNPRDAASHLAIAVSSDGALIAADLGGSARNGIWLGIGSEPSDVPPIGEWQRGGGVRDFNCAVNLGTGEPNPREAIAACEALIQRHADFIVEHAAGFRRLFRIDREGVRAAKPDGALATVEGAKAAFKVGPKGATVEVSLPAKALPRVTGAPVQWLDLFARAALTPAPPAFDGAKWVLLDLPDPVGFEPWAELRAKAFEELSSSLGRPYLSYHPGDPLHIEVVGYDGGAYNASRVGASEETLYTKQATLGDVEVGLVSAYNTWIAIFKKGKLLDLVSVSGRLMGAFEHDGEIHVLSYSQYTSTDIWAESAGWSAITVAADGSHRDDAVEQKIASFPWNEVAEFHSKKLDSFGVRGWTSFTHGGKEEGVELTWRWDKSTKIYVGKRRSIPVHKKPEKKP